MSDETNVQTCEDALSDLIWAIEASEGEFSLILAVCNYAELGRRVLKRLHKACPLDIQEVRLGPGTTNLYHTLSLAVEHKTPDAAIVMGFDACDPLDELFAAANQTREEFRRAFSFPLILWLNDEALIKLMRIAPDLENWSGSYIRFEPSEQELPEALRGYVAHLFEEIFGEREGGTSEKNRFLCDLSNSHEFQFFLKDLEKRNLDSDSELKADLHFLQGWHEQLNEQWDSAICFYEKSLSFWQEISPCSDVPASEYHGVLFYLMARCHEGKGDWEEAKLGFQKCMVFFESRRELAAKCACKLCGVLEKSKEWEELEETAEKALEQNQTCGNTAECANCYRFLAEAALNKGEPKKALQFAEKVLDTHSPETRDKARLILANAHRCLGEPKKAIAYLEKAREEGEPDLNPRLYSDILLLLHDLYFEQKRYLEAFQIKQDRYVLEYQFGFRAFIGAGRLKPLRQTRDKKGDIAQEIQASGRWTDVEKLMRRLEEPKDKLIVLHGQSGVGKSSILEAGLEPTLKEKRIKGRSVLPVLMRSYVNWMTELKQCLSSALRVSEISEDILDELRKNDEQNFLTVLIFDQFEEFFFANPNPGDREKFYEFLNDCLENISFVKVILSLREDYLHYLLESEGFVEAKVMERDILARKIRYPLGNFTKNDAKEVILSLIRRSQFQPEDQLIDKIVDDLAKDSKGVRPIELQIVGSRIEAKTIDSLEKYRPKEELISDFLEEAVGDCGTENQDAANLILYLLTDEKFTRPLKTRAEILNELRDSGLETVTDGQLGLILDILEGAGLIFVVPGKPERYQLVHDYLAEFVRGRGQGSNLLAELKVEREKSKAEQERRKKAEKRFVRFALAAGILIVMILTSLFVREKMNAQQIEAQRQKAEISATDAEAQRKKAEKQKVIAEKQHVEAEKQRKIAEEQKAIADEKRTEAEEQASRAKESELKARISAIETLNASSNALFLSNDKLGAAIAGMKAMKSSNREDIPDILKDKATCRLRRIIYDLYEKNRLEGHNSHVLTVKFSPDGKALASGSSDNTIKLWNAENGREIISLRGHEAISSVDFSPDGAILASGSDDNTVKLWNIKDGSIIKTLKGHSHNVLSVNFSPNGKILASGGFDKTIKLWDIKDGDLVRELKGHRKSILSIDFSPDGKILASGSEDRTIKLWNAEDGSMIKTLKGHFHHISSVNFSPDGKILASGSFDNTVKLWNVGDGSEIATLEGHSHHILSVNFSPDGKIVASGGFDNTIKLWNVEDGSEIGTLKGHLNYVRSVEFSPDGKIIVSGSEDKTIRLWKVEDIVEINTLTGHSNYVRSVRFSPDGKILASASFDKTIKLWNVETMQSVGPSLKGHLHYISDVGFSPDGKILASGSFDKTIKLWNLENMRLIKTLRGHSDYVLSISFSPDGKVLASGSRDRTIKLWNMEKKKVIETLEGHSDAVRSVTFSPDGKILASGSWDNTIKLWNINNNGSGSFKTLNSHSNVVESLKFSPSGRTLASGSFDNTIKLWRVEDGSEIKTLKGHSNYVRSVTFSPDEKILASGSWDNTVKLWCIDDGCVIRTLKGHSHYVLSVDFSPNGVFLASGSWDATIKLWNLAKLYNNLDLGLSDLLKRGCECLRPYLKNPNAKLSEEERCLCDDVLSEP